MKNLQGDVVSIVDAVGEVVVEYTYDAWGKLLTTTGTLASTIGAYNPFRYRGYYYDSETGWYYLQSRYYDPIVGRFLNADCIIGANGDLVGYNLFAYCSNNPLKHVDSTGTCIYGDGYWWMQFASHDLFAGDICEHCGKQVDEVFEAHPLLWTDVYKANKHLTGAQISQLVLCTLAEGKAQVKASAKTHTQTEYRRVYQQEMATALCFVAGTIVKTENGDETIENIEVGDYVWAYDTESGETALKRVVRLFRNQTIELVAIEANGEKIEATPEHPFYVLNCDSNSTGLGKGWVRAKDLRVGDILVLFNGETVTVETITHIKLDEPITVYNFEVEDFHTYFVGMTGLLAHNSCLPTATGGSASYKRYDMSDKYHSFPSIVDNYAEYYGVHNDCVEYRANGSYGGHDGYFQWYVYGGQVVHRQFIY